MTFVIKEQPSPLQVIIHIIPWRLLTVVFKCIVCHEIFTVFFYTSPPASSSIPHILQVIPFPIYTSAVERVMNDSQCDRSFNKEVKQQQKTCSCSHSFNTSVAMWKYPKTGLIVDALFSFHRHYSQILQLCVTIVESTNNWWQTWSNIQSYLN